MPRAYFAPHEVANRINDAVSLLMDACDTDDVYWSTMATGQDTEEAEHSGYLAGYRDALSAVQMILNHANDDSLREMCGETRDAMQEQQQETEEIDPGPHFWSSAA